MVLRNMHIKLSQIHHRNQLEKSAYYLIRKYTNVTAVMMLLHMEHCTKHKKWNVDVNHEINICYSKG